MYNITLNPQSRSYNGAKPTEGYYSTYCRGLGSAVQGIGKTMHNSNNFNVLEAGCRNP